MKLATLRKFALSLPEVTEEPHHDFGSFRVRGKIFVTVPPGEEFIHVFAPEPVREQALGALLLVCREASLGRQGARCSRQAERC